MEKRLSLPWAFLNKVLVKPGLNFNSWKSFYFDHHYNFQDWNLFGILNNDRGESAFFHLSCVYSKMLGAKLNLKIHHDERIYSKNFRVSFGSQFVIKSKNFLLSELDSGNLHLSFHDKTSTFVGQFLFDTTSVKGIIENGVLKTGRYNRNFVGVSWIPKIQTQIKSSQKFLGQTQFLSTKSNQAYIKRKVFIQNDNSSFFIFEFKDKYLAWNCCIQHTNDAEYFWTAKDFNFKMNESQMFLEIEKIGLSSLWKKHRHIYKSGNSWGVGLN